MVTWGREKYGGDSRAVQQQLQGDIVNIYSTFYAFAALKVDGAVVTWGAADAGGDSSTVQQQLEGEIEHIYSTEAAFAALKFGGSVVTWGDEEVQYRARWSSIYRKRSSTFTLRMSLLQR